MGALAPAAPWIPEDDLQLKNAVEAGASLESLAKGAVQFSRRYTVRELQERWYSLLYDPVISVEASAGMFKYERSAPSQPSKLGKVGNSKENKCLPGKRKGQSVRSCYYALRKRLGNEPLDYEDFDYLVGPSNGTCIRSGEGTLTGDYILEEPNSSHFELQESDIEIVKHAFPDILLDEVVNTTSAVMKDTDNGTEGILIGEAELSKEVPSPLKKAPSYAELFDSNHIDSEPLPDFPPLNHNVENVCQELEQNHAFNSPILDCGTAYHGLDCSSPLPNMPIWKAVEGISMPDDISLKEKHLSIEEAFDIEDMEIKDADQSIVSAKGYLEELSKSLLNSTNEDELLFMDVDSKDGFDKSYYDGFSSLLLNSPVDANQEGEAPELPEAVTASIASKDHVIHDDIGKSEERMVSTVSGSTMQFPETCDEVMFCTLNMEDPDIPCNDDVVFPKPFAPSSVPSKGKGRFQENSNSNPPPSLGKEFSANPRTLERIPSISHGHGHGLSKPMVSARNPSNLPVGSARGINCEVSSSNINANLPERLGAPDVSTLALKEEPLESGIKHLTGNSFNAALDEPLNDSDKFQCRLPDGAQEVRDPLDPEIGSINHACRDSWVGLSFSPPERIESDDELPSFSDVEAMILDMDLDPDDQELYSNEEVLRYNDEETRRRIVRLEQAANSCMQRAIASHGAFAVLYGRYSKHYIKKQEVLVGRGTEGFKVDIDLSAEGRFNKISRRQATLKLEKNGSILLKNLGNKFPIFVNNKPVAPGMSIALTSNCLIEIRGTPLMFVINENRVKRFVERMEGRQKQEQR